MKNVLLVDDDYINNFINKITLQRTGRVNYVDTALNGQQALNLFNDYYNYKGEHPFPDVILLDLNMPVMGGFEFLKTFKQMPLPHKEDIEIVILSSSQDDKDMFHAKELGASRYLNKPLTEALFLKLFNTLVPG